MNSNTPTAGFTLLPKTGNFEEISTAIDNVFSLTISESEAALTQTKDEPTVKILPSQNNQTIFPKAKIEIQNGTWTVGLASRFQKKLEDNGFSVNKIGNAVERPIATTTIFLINQNTDPEIYNNLKKLLQAELSTTLPEWLETNYDNAATQEDESGLKYLADTDILIILGQNTKE